MVSPTNVRVESPPRQVRRASRFDARYQLWDLSTLRRVKACGRYAANSETGVTLKASGSVVDGTREGGISGAQSCGSVWACAVCAQKIQAKRQTEVAVALAVARLRGWEVLFLTLTMRHDRAHRLKRLWDHLSTAWSAVTTGSGQRAWKADKLDYGIQGYLRLVEVTHGHDNGWHVHAHVLLFCDPAQAEVLQELGSERRDWFSDRQVNELGTRMFLRWRGALNVKGIRPSARRGVDIRRVRTDEQIDAYFAKQMYSRKGEGSTAHDVSGSHGKDAKNGNRTPFGILRSLVDHSMREGGTVNKTTGEIDDSWTRDLELWHTFEKASKGRRQLLWARGLRADLLGDDEGQDDQAVVDEAPGGEDVVHISASVFKSIARQRLLADMLEALESDDTGDGIRLWLNDGLRWHIPDREPE